MFDRWLAAWTGAWLVLAPLAANAFVLHRGDDGGQNPPPPLAGGAGPTTAPLPVLPAPKRPTTTGPLPCILDPRNPWIPEETRIEPSLPRTPYQPLDSANPDDTAQATTASKARARMALLPSRNIGALDTQNPFGIPNDETPALPRRYIGTIDKRNPFAPARIAPVEE